MVQYVSRYFIQTSANTDYTVHSSCLTITIDSKKLNLSYLHNTRFARPPFRPRRPERISAPPTPPPAPSSGNNNSARKRAARRGSAERTTIDARARTRQQLITGRGWGAFDIVYNTAPFETRKSNRGTVYLQCVRRGFVKGAYATRARTLIEQVCNISGVA